MIVLIEARESPELSAEEANRICQGREKGSDFPAARSIEEIDHIRHI